MKNILYIDDILLEKRIISEENSFNAVRMLCCLIVIIRHCFDLNMIKSRGVLILDSHVAVCVFFILSGFWVLKSFLSSKDVKTFYIKRIKRLYPLYVCSILFFILLCSFFSEKNQMDYFKSIDLYKYLFWNLITMNFLQPTLPGVFLNNPYVNTVNGALWTIKVELGFYIILPLLILIAKKLKTVKKNIIFFSTIYILSVIYRMCFNLFPNQLGRFIFLRDQLPAYMSYFIIGMMFYIFWNYFSAKLIWFILPSILFFVVHYFTTTEIFLPISLGIIVLFVSTRFSIFNRIGKPYDYSYGMYLSHFPMIQLMIQKNFFVSSFGLSIILVISFSFLWAFIGEKYIQNIKKIELNPQKVLPIVVE